MKKTIIAGVMACLMSSCVSRVWVKQGVSREQAYQEMTDCQKIAAGIGGDNPFILRSAYSACMKQRGYVLEEEVQR